jgi:glutaminase
MDADARTDRILDVLSAAAGRRLRIDEETFLAEYRTAHRNMAIAHMLRSVDQLPGEPQDVFRGYTRQCSVLVTCEDLAMMGATLASGGIQPLTGEQIFSPDAVRQTLAVLTTCGMYNNAGDWVTSVGLPAKSGVAGGILGVLPGAVGMATYSPRLDAHGTSVRGHLLFEKLSREHEMHFLDPRHWRNVSWRMLDEPPD